LFCSFEFFWILCPQKNSNSAHILFERMNFSHLLFAFGSYGTGSLVRAGLGFWEGRITYTANFV